MKAYKKEMEKVVKVVAWTYAIVCIIAVIVAVIII